MACLLAPVSYISFRRCSEVSFENRPDFPPWAAKFHHLCNCVVPRHRPDSLFPASKRGLVNAGRARVSGRSKSGLDGSLATAERTA